ncbi:hypothetical protein OH492_14125 [Vibrio chagasii]|nr:hypothetical protein [Vibrio chagasii]
MSLGNTECLRGDNIGALNLRLGWLSPEQTGTHDLKQNRARTEPRSHLLCWPNTHFTAVDSAAEPAEHWGWLPTKRFRLKHQTPL